MKKPKRVESVIPGDINPIKSRPSEFNRELQSGSKNGSLDKKPKVASGNLATDSSKLDTRQSGAGSRLGPVAGIHSARNSELVKQSDVNALIQGSNVKDRRLSNASAAKSDSRTGEEAKQRQVISQADMLEEMNFLNTVDKERLNFDNLPQNPPHERLSTIRGDRRKEKTQWNLTISWGEEFKIYSGEYYPETCACFEGELQVGDKDFEDLLSPKELELLREIELGDEF